MKLISVLFICLILFVSSFAMADDYLNVPATIDTDDLVYRYSTDCADKCDKEVEDDGITRTMAVPYYDPMKLSLLTKVIGDTAYIKVFSSLTQNDEMAIYDDLQKIGRAHV